MMSVDVAIVGGGPVGLALACHLARLGIDRIAVRERRTAIGAHSRAIGIHPPALATLSTLGIADELIDSGVKIRAGRAFYGRRPLGVMSLEHTGAAYPFALSVPQAITEARLEAHLQRVAPGALRRGATVNAIVEHADWVMLTACTGDRVETLRASLVVRCDGVGGALDDTDARPDGAWPDSYLMADVADGSDLGADAALFLGPDGITESFPLPQNRRRWVIHTGRRQDADPEFLAALVAQRTGIGLAVDPEHHCTAFGIRQWRRREMVSGRIVFAGDCAHVVSPIGGQGMNLGLLDAAALAPAIAAILHGGADRERTLAAWSRTRTRAAQTALGRAAFNTWMGRPLPIWHPAIIGAWAALQIRPLNQGFARRFTMSDLGAGD